MGRWGRWGPKDLIRPKLRGAGAVVQRKVHGCDGRWHLPQACGVERGAGLAEELSAGTARPTLSIPSFLSHPFCPSHPPKSHLSPPIFPVHPPIRRTNSVPPIPPIPEPPPPPPLFPPILPNPYHTSCASRPRNPSDPQHLSCTRNPFHPFNSSQLPNASHLPHPSCAASACSSSCTPRGSHTPRTICGHYGGAKAT